MAGEVGQRLPVLRPRLRRLAQDDATISAAPGEVPTLAIAGGARYRLDGERGAARREPPGDDRVGERPEVVGVGDEHLGEPLVEERVDQTGALEHGIQVAVSGRAPLERGVGRPVHRAQVVGAQLGDAVLAHLQGDGAGGEVRVGGEGLQAVGGRAERVQEGDRQPSAGGSSERQHLTGDHVEERQVISGAQERLGPIQPHRRAQPTVELDDRRGGDGRGADVVGHVLVAQRRRVVRLDVGFRDHARGAAGERPVVVGEGVERRLGEAISAHGIEALGEGSVIHPVTLSQLRRPLPHRRRQRVPRLIRSATAGTPRRRGRRPRPPRPAPRRAGGTSRRSCRGRRPPARPSSSVR